MHVAAGFLQNFKECENHGGELHDVCVKWPANQSASQFSLFTRSSFTPGFSPTQRRPRFHYRGHQKPVTTRALLLLSRMIGSVFPPVEAFFQTEPSLRIESYFEGPLRTGRESPRHAEKLPKSTGITGTQKCQIPPTVPLRSRLLTPHWAFSQRERSLPPHKRLTRSTSPAPPTCSFLDLQHRRAPCKCLRNDVFLYSRDGKHSHPSGVVFGRFPAHSGSLQSSSSGGCVSAAQEIPGPSRIQQFCKTLDDARNRIATQHNLLVALQRARQLQQRTQEEPVDEEETAFDFGDDALKPRGALVPSGASRKQVVSLGGTCAFLPSKILRGFLSSFERAEDVLMFIPWLLSLKEDMVFRKMRYRSALASCRAHITRLTQENNALRARVRMLNRTWGCGGSERLFSNDTKGTPLLLQKVNEAIQEPPLKMPPEVSFLPSDGATSVRYCTVSNGGALEYTPWEPPAEKQSSSLLSKENQYLAPTEPLGSDAVTYPIQSSEYPKPLDVVHDNRSGPRRLTLELNAVRCAIRTKFSLSAAHCPGESRKHVCSLERVVAVHHDSKAPFQNLSRSVIHAVCQTPIQATGLNDLDKTRSPIGQGVMKQMVALNTITRNGPSKLGVHHSQYVRSIVQINWASTFALSRKNENLGSCEANHNTRPLNTMPKRERRNFLEYSPSEVIFAKGKTKSPKRSPDNIQDTAQSTAVVIQVPEKEEPIVPLTNQVPISRVLDRDVASISEKRCKQTQYTPTQLKGAAQKALQFHQVRQDSGHEEDAATFTSYISHVSSKPLGAFHAPPSARVFRMVAGSVSEVPLISSDQSKLGNDRFLYGSPDVSRNSGRSRVVQRRIRLAAMGKGSLILGSPL